MATTTLIFLGYVAFWAVIVWRFARRDERATDWAGGAGLAVAAGLALLLVAYVGSRHETEPLAVLVFSIAGGLLFVSGVLTFVLNALPAPRHRR
jgi:hypothetical protein